MERHQGPSGNSSRRRVAFARGDAHRVVELHHGGEVGEHQVGARRLGEELPEAQDDHRELPGAARKTRDVRSTLSRQQEQRATTSSCSLEGRGRREGRKLGGGLEPLEKAYEDAHKEAGEAHAKHAHRALAESIVRIRAARCHIERKRHLHTSKCLICI